MIIPKNVTRIGDSAFFGCGNITSVTISDSVTRIGDYAFNWCGVTRLTIPSKVTYIGNWGFHHCQLRDIYYNGTKSQWKKISKGKEWDKDTGKYIVHCTDGDLKKSIFS